MSAHDVLGSLRAAESELTTLRAKIARVESLRGEWADSPSGLVRAAAVDLEDAIGGAV